MYNDDGTISYKELKTLYSRYFSIGYLNGDIDKKFALISLLGYVTYKAREKNPDVTFLQIINKLDTKNYLNDDFKKALAIVCDDFCRDCKNYPLFGLEGKKIIETIQNLFSIYVPF